MSLSWSGDIPLAGSPGGLRGTAPIGKDPGDRIELALLPGDGNEWRLRVRRVRGGGVLFDATAPPEPDGRGFLRFEFALPVGRHDGVGRGLLDPSRLTVQVDRRGGLKASFANSPFGLSYLPVLRRFLEAHPAPRILEWGPGRSTIMMAEWSPSARILGIEHDPGWHRRCLDIAERFPNVEVVLQRVSLRPGESGCYATFPFHRADRYDLVFVDGRLRCDCLAVARRVVSPEGVVLLHDAHRANYRPGTALFSSCETVAGTAVLRP